MQMIEFIFHHFPFIFVPSHFEWSWMWMTARPLMPHPLLLPWGNATAANSVSWRQTKWFTNPMMQFLIYPTCQNLVIFCYSNTRYSCLLINRRQFNKVSCIFHVQHLHHICHDKKKSSLHNSNIAELTVFLLWYKLYNTFWKGHYVRKFSLENGSSILANTWNGDEPNLPTQADHVMFHCIFCCVWNLLLFFVLCWCWVGSLTCCKVDARNLRYFARCLLQHCYSLPFFVFYSQAKPSNKR